MTGPTGIVDNAAAMPYIYGAFIVTALLLVGLGIYFYTALKASSKEAERLNPRKKAK